MKIQIDTELKIIQVEQQCKLVELFDFVKKIFPDNKWKEYSIEAIPYIYNWNNPIYVPTQIWHVQELPTITCNGENGSIVCLQTN